VKQLDKNVIKTLPTTVEIICDTTSVLTRDDKRRI